MENNSLIGALTGLSERLTAFNKRVGPYRGHVSTGKGITMNTSSGSLFLYHSFIRKLIFQPEDVTNEELQHVALSLH